MSTYSLYLHIPFCRHRCGYCDFNTYAGLDRLIPDYVEALCREVALAAEAAAGAGFGRLAVHTIFFGGGTPSLVPLEGLEQVLEAIAARYELQPGLEVTLEANPGTVSLEYLRGLRALGVNRLSLGMQSALPAELALLERQHAPQDVAQAVTWARQAGFANLNLDLIFGLPYQTLEQWQASLETALKLGPDHVALYALTLEHGTPLQSQVERGLLPRPDDDQAAEMYEWAARRLDQAGYTQYEISNWARASEGEQDLTCRHNVQYWRNLPYLGFGAGAHGYAAGYRTANVLAPAAYIQRLQSGELQPFPRTPATASAILIDRRAEIGETLMMGLRLTRAGISRQAFVARFGEPVEVIFKDEIERLMRYGLLEYAGEGGDILRLTPQGRLLGNQVFMEFV